jgi:aminocarboxymuconate-semialdehyde decarboxylase
VTGPLDGAVIVDHQFHWYPSAYADVLAKRSAVPRVEIRDGGQYLHIAEGAGHLLAPLTRDLEDHLADASACGIDVVVIGPGVLGDVLHIPAREAARLLDRLHEEYAGAQRDHPDRVACLAALPLQDPAVAIEVLDRAIIEYDLRGVSLLPHVEGEALGTAATLPVFERIEALGVPVFLHPGYRTSTHRPDVDARAEIGLGWMYHTSLGALSLVDSGILDACPELVVVHPHLGGMLPYVAGRVGNIPGGTAKHDLREYLHTRFYVDSVSSTAPALELAREMYGPDRIVFGTDHPYVPMAAMRAYVETNASAEFARKIFANRVPGLRLGSSGDSAGT